MNWKMWGWVPKPEEPEPVVLKIPADKVQGILKLRDDYARIPSGADAEAHYLLWCAIAEIYPCVRVGSWAIQMDNAFTIYIRQKSAS